MVRREDHLTDPPSPCHLVLVAALCEVPGTSSFTSTSSFTTSSFTGPGVQLLLALG